MRCTIVATGNSLRGFDFGRIKDYTIAVNDAYKYCNYDICVSFDKKKALEFKGNKEKLHTLARNSRKIPFDTTKINSNEYLVSDNYELSFNYPYVGAFRSTLLFGINIAILKGFTDIHILGADNKLSDYRYFYDTNPSTKDSDFKIFLTYMKMIQQDINHKKIALTFYDSTIKLFNNKDLSEY